MNIAIQTDDELVMFYTDGGIERAKEVCEKSNLTVEDIYEIRDDEMEYYCFDSRVYDSNLSNK